MNNFPSPPSDGLYVAAPVTPYVAAATPKTDGLAVAGMVLGIVGMWFGLIYLIVPALAIIFSGVALNRINKSLGWRKGKGMAIAGLCTGIVGFALWASIFLAGLAS